MMKDSEVLRAAKLEIELRREEFIRYAIGRCVGEVDRNQRHRLAVWVQTMILPFYTVNGWLSEQPNWKGPMDTKKTRKYRIAWLDQLIKICESEGD